MIDSVLKGNGNSRFLKSAVPAGTSWADALAMLQAGTFPIDFNGINAEGFQQVGTPLNKANLLKDATAAQIGLPPSTTPDGMFQALGNTGELHVWRKTVVTSQEIPAGYKLGSVQTGGFTLVSSNYITYEYGTPTISDDGTVGLSVAGTMNVNYQSNLNDLKGKFCRTTASGGTSFPDGQVIFIPGDAVFSTVGVTKETNKYQPVTGYAKIPAGTTTTYPVSTNPNAYQEGDDAKEAGYTLGEVVTGMFRINAVYNNTTIYYASSVKVADNGAVTLANRATQGLEAGEGSYNDAKKLAGKFIIADYNHSYCKIPKGVVLFIPANTTISFRQDVPGDEGYGIFFDRYQPVTGYAAIPAGTTIEYLGKLGDKARVQVVSYVGTGVSGSAHPTTVTFDFVPKIVIAHCQNNEQYHFIAPYGIEYTQVRNSLNDHPLTITWENKTMSYQNNSPSLQMNSSGVTYIVVAIG